MYKQTKLAVLRGLVLFLGAIAFIHTSQAATVAGRVVFATGNPVATDTAGTQRSLGRGDDVFAGDNLRTPVNSRLQVSFKDGAYISLQPNSEYEIEEYKYAGQPDGSESAVYRLLKGGVRAVTGLIGKENPEAYKVKTAVATIGIRGTGHNTRICQGDCPGKDDGLYHSTWEGITYVANNAETVNVPSGRSVFVRNLNSLIQFLNQPPAVTALETAGQREEEQEEQEEESRTVTVGDQRSSGGEQEILVEQPQDIVPTSSTVLLNQGFLVVLPSPLDDLEPVDIFSGDNPAMFLNDSGGLIGLVATDDEDGGRTFGTIDIDAMLGGDNTTAVSEFNSLLGQADPLQISRFRENQATLAESVFNSGGLSWGRWSNGLILSFDTFDGQTELDELTGNQSLHYIFGPEPASIPTMGQALYDFIGGTRSTSLSGATIGQGVTGGNIAVDFASSNGFLQMDVLHNSTEYFVAGQLIVGNNEIFDQTNGVFATTTASGSACNPDCPTFIDGGFAGPADSSGPPKHIGIEYDIHEDDIITGVAGFGFVALPPTPASTVLQNNVFVAVFPDLGISSGFDSVVGSNASLFAVNNQIVGALSSDFDGIRVLDTINPDAVLNGDNSTAVNEAGTLLSSVPSTQLDNFSANPATVTDSQLFADGMGWGRWTNGRILSVDDTGLTDGGDLVNNQSVHFIFGPELTSAIPTSGTATYMLAGGTRSTSVSGDTIGSAPNVGSINIDFGNTSQEAMLQMQLDHNNTTYDVGGTLGFSSFSDGVFDIDVTALTFDPVPGGSCNTSPGCSTFIEGGFAGPMDPGGPRHIGFQYAIQETDPITGVAGFELQ